MTNATITLEDLKTMEASGYALIRSQDEQAWALMALVLRLSAESGLTTDDHSVRIEVSNVYPLSEYMHASGRTSA